MPPRRDAAPSPYDVLIDGVGYVSPRSGGAPAQREASPVDDLDGRHGEDTLTLGEAGGWEYGVGMRAYAANLSRYGGGTGSFLVDPQARRTIYYAEAGGVGPAGDTLGGGADGSYGPLIPGPLLTLTTPDGGTGLGKVRDLVEFTPAGGTQGFLDAQGRKIYRATNPAFTGSSAVFTHTTGVTIRRLRAFTGENSMPRLYALCQNAEIYSTVDGTNWARIGNRLESPTAFLKTQDTGATYTDYTSNVAGAGVATLGGGTPLGTLPASWVLIGHTHPFATVEWTMSGGAVNGTANVAAADYWTGTAWAAMTLNTDNTVAAGPASLGIVGPATMVLTRPPAAWVRAPLTELGADGAGPTLTASLFWMRVSWSAAMDATTDVDTVRVYVAQEGLCGAVLGDEFAVVGPDSSTIYHTRSGGTAPTWLSNFDPLPRGGTAIDMVAAGDTWWVLGTNHLSAVGPDGAVKTYYPELFQGGAVDVDTAFARTWLGRFVIFSLGAGRGLYMLDPYTGDLQIIGPERQFLNDEVLSPYVTCVVGDRTHSLFAGWATPGGRCFLAKWGGYQPGNTDSGTPEFTRADAWHMIGDLGTGRVVTGMGAWIAAGQPYVAFGTDQSEVLTFKAPVGASPLASGSGYAYSSRQANIVLPTWRGGDQNRKVEAYAATLQTRHLSSTIGATFQTRDFAAGGAWTTQFGTTSDAAARQAFAAPYAGFGMDSLLVMTMGNQTSTPWIIDRIQLHQQPEVLDSQFFTTVTVLADDDVVCADGRAIPKRAQDWLDAIDALLAKKTPVTLVRASGKTEQVLPRGRGQVEVRADRFGSRKQAVTIYLSTAEGAPN